MDYPKYDDINLKKFEIFNAPASLIEEYENWDHGDLKTTNQNFSEKEIDFIKKFYPWLGGTCSIPMGRKKDTVSTVAYRNGIGVEHKNHLDQKNTYSYSNFIKNPDADTAYILGFLWADGTIGTNKSKKWNNTIKLKIANEDFVEVKECFMNSAPWRYRVSEIPPYKDQAIVEIADRLFHDFLTEMDYRDKSNGIAPLKILDFLKNELESHFVRGFFDGDGSFIYGAKCDKKVCFCSCKEQDWSFLEKIGDKLNIDWWVQRTNRNSNFMVSNVAGIEKLYKYMYKGADVFLPRKKVRFKKFFELKNNARPNKLSKYRGVTKEKGKWLMQVYDKSIKRNICKRFDNELDAAKEYDRLAVKLFGNKARLNFEY